jgi:hypothetical protein
MNSSFQDSRAKYIGQPPSTNLGRYSVPYRITRSGQYSLSVIQANSGGLDGTYFQGGNFSQQVFNQLDSQVNVGQLALDEILICFVKADSSI